MSDLAIRVQGLGKRYRLGARQKTYRDFREHLAEAVKLPFRRLRSALAGGSTILSDESIWALEDVSFDVEVGEVVGVIGRNGAGKTTLLKVLSRITEPTEGRAEIHGRVASLLEVGTGFHPELTGRENVYLNGAILGMGRSEIDRKFDEIVAFAEVERFLDTQVKHYSSGMYLRLAFAVAAHLEPEILLVDEVLAVGDASFQRKCLGKMQDVSGEGRTVLFVSHNMTAIRQLCRRCLLFEDGRLAEDGPTEPVVDGYLERAAEPNRDGFTPGMHRVCDGVWFRSAEIASLEGSPLPAPKNFRPLVFNLELEVERPMACPMITVAIDTVDSVPLTRVSTGESTASQNLDPGTYRVRIETVLPFSPGTFEVILRADQVRPSSRPLAVLRNAFRFQLQESRNVGFNGARRPYRKELVPISSAWNLERRSSSAPTTGTSG